MKFEELEQIRKNYTHRFMKTLAISACICLLPGILLFGSFFAVRGSGLFVILPLIFLFLFVFSISYIFATIFTKSDKAKYNDAYKTYFVDSALKKIFTDINYLHESGFSSGVLSSTGMMRTGDVYHSNDYVSGKYKDVCFSQADVCIQDEHSDSDGNTNYVTVFRGRWMVFEFPKKFISKMSIVLKGFRGNLVPRSNLNGKKIKKMQTESITFSKKFTVYAEDGLEMFYILTPDIIQRIEDIAVEGKRKIIFCFVDNKLHVGLHNNNDAFEPPRPFKPIDENVELIKIQADIKPITDFIDSLKLDKKLFKN